MSLDPTFVYANYVEACLWASIGVIALVKRNGRASWWLAATFIAFGGSDVVEAHTGAWYRPWWLFVWKAMCVLLILILGVKVMRSRKRAYGSQAPRG